MTTLYTGYTLKAIKEALSYAQTYLPNNHEGNYYRFVLSDIIHDIDNLRPIGPDGVHGDLHTESCGCEDK